LPFLSFTANLSASIDPIDEHILPPPPLPSSALPSESHRVSPSGSQTYSFHRKYGTRKKSFIGFEGSK